MGRKIYLPYGMYEAYVFYTPVFAKRTGVHEEGLEVFRDFLVDMWDLDHSAARGRMACRGFMYLRVIANLVMHHRISCLINWISKKYLNKSPVRIKIMR
ncbi:type I CRISPR-associated protein Cas7 [Sporosarcina limicola]|uniref:type I CRISPR-associated protein Cas7 n=1 Tax=Sporosarcina limicola TaxID=34101 RepID=UPI0017890DCD